MGLLYSGIRSWEKELLYMCGNASHRINLNREYRGHSVSGHSTLKPTSLMWPKFFPDTTVNI